MSDVWLNTPPGTRVRGSWTNERAASDHVTEDQPMRIAGQQVNTLPVALLLVTLSAISQHASALDAELTLQQVSSRSPDSIE